MTGYKLNSYKIHTIKKRIKDLKKNIQLNECNKKLVWIKTIA